MTYIQALRTWIMHEDQALASGRLILADVAKGNPGLARAFDFLAAAYRAITLQLGLAPIPDQLEFFGPAGEIIRAVTCHTRGCWSAFRRGVERRYPDIPWPTPLTEAGYTFQSYAERLVFRVLQNLSGITVMEVHPRLGASNRRADFLLTAVNGRSVYVEVTMLGTNPESDNACQNEYRARLTTKLLTYVQLGLELPVIIGIDDLGPRGLEAKVAEILERLALPVPEPRPPGWFQGECDGGLT